MLRIEQLEQYSLMHPNEVLVIHAMVEGEEDEVVIFKGFSSSLMRSTAFDPDIPVLPDSAKINTVDRLKGPLNPSKPQPLELNIAWDEFVQRLS